MERSEQPKSTFVEVNGHRLHYLDWGNPQAPVMVLLHGFRDDAHSFDSFARDIRSRYHVLALDQRGHGDSAWVPDGYSHASFAQEFEAFVSRLGLNDFILVGHSMGGMIGIGFAAAHPDVVRRLIIIDVGPELNAQTIAHIRRHDLQGGGEFATAEEAFAYVRERDPLPRDDVVRYRVEHALKRLPSGMLTWKSDPAMAGVMRSRRRVSPDVIWERLAGIECPSLLVRGGMSALMSRELARRIVDALPRGRLAEVPMAGHRVAEDNAKGLVDAVTRFLEEPESDERKMR